MLHTVCVCIHIQHAIYTIKVIKTKSSESEMTHVLPQDSDSDSDLLVDTFAFKIHKFFRKS